MSGETSNSDLQSMLNYVNRNTSSSLKLQSTVNQTAQKFLKFEIGEFIKIASFPGTAVELSKFSFSKEELDEIYKSHGQIIEKSSAGFYLVSFNEISPFYIQTVNLLPVDPIWLKNFKIGDFVRIRKDHEEGKMSSEKQNFVGSVGIVRGGNLENLVILHGEIQLLWKPTSVELLTTKQIKLLKQQTQKKNKTGQLQVGDIVKLNKNRIHPRYANKLCILLAFVEDVEPIVIVYLNGAFLNVYLVGVQLVARVTGWIQQPNSGSLTVALSAVTLGNLERLIELINKNLCESRSEELMWKSCSHDHGHIVDWLLEHGAHVDYVDNYGTPLPVVLAQENKFNALQSLLNHKIDLENVIDSMGQNAFHAAAGKGHDQIVVMLLKENKWNINQKDFTGRTPLLVALLKQQLRVACLLIDNGAALNERNKEGCTLMHVLALYSHLELWECVKRQSINNDFSSFINFTINLSGKSALHVAVEKENEIAVDFLLTLPFVDVNQVDNNSCTPLHLAMKLIKTKNQSTTQNFHSIVQIAKNLVKKGASINNLNSEGKSPLDLCTLVKLREELQQIALEVEENLNRLVEQAQVVEEEEEVEKVVGKEEEDAPLVVDQTKSQSDDQSKEIKYEQLVLKITCPVCAQKWVKEIFACGHACCLECSENLYQCPVCRTQIIYRTLIRFLN